MNHILKVPSFSTDHKGSLERPAQLQTPTLHLDLGEMNPNLGIAFYVLAYSPLPGFGHFIWGK